MLNSSAEDKYASKPGREDSTEKKKEIAQNITSIFICSIFIMLSFSHLF